MTGLEQSAYILSIAATALSWAVAKRDREHLPVAAFLSLGLIADLGKRALWLSILAAAYERASGAPLTGADRVARDVYDALYFSWPAALTALSLRAFSKRNPWPVAVAYVLIMLVCIVGYPAIRGAVHQRIYLSTELASVLVGVGLLVQWYWRRERTTSLVVSATLILGIEGGLLLGPYMSTDPHVHWDRGQVMFTVLFGALTVVQVVTWISKSRVR